MRIGRHEEAIQQLESELRLSTVDVVDLSNAYVALAAAYNHPGRPDLGLYWAERTLARSPISLPALTNAIVALAELGRHQEARRYGQRMLAVNPQDFRAYRSV